MRKDEETSVCPSHHPGSYAAQSLNLSCSRGDVSAGERGTRAERSFAVIPRERTAYRSIRHRDIHNSVASWLASPLCSPVSRSRAEVAQRFLLCARRSTLRSSSTLTSLHSLSTSRPLPPAPALDPPSLSLALSLCLRTFALAPSAHRVTRRDTECTRLNLKGGRLKNKADSNPDNALPTRSCGQY